MKVERAGPVASDDGRENESDSQIVGSGGRIGPLLREHRKYWLGPIVLAFLLLGIQEVFARSEALIRFFYYSF